VGRIVNSGNDYIVQLKANQPKLLQFCQQTASKKQPLARFSSEEKGRGRLEKRELVLFEADRKNEIARLWPGFRRIICINRSGLRGAKPYNQTHWYISSLQSNDASLFAKGIRGHWSIENQLHWVKDVVQNEDNCRIQYRAAAENLSTFKSIAINLYHINGYKSITHANRFFANKVKELFLPFSGNSI
jgi:hypothetical protein